MARHINFKETPVIGPYQRMMVLVLDSIPGSEKTGMMRKIMALASKIEDAKDGVDLDPEEYRMLIQAIEGYSWKFFNQETGEEIPKDNTVRKLIIAFEDHIKDAKEVPEAQEEKDAA